MNMCGLDLNPPLILGITEIERHGILSMPTPTRRQAVKTIGGLALSLVGSAVPNPGRLTKADDLLAFTEPPLLPNVQFIGPDSSLNGPRFNAYTASTFKVPRLRALCRSAEGVAACVRWAAEEEIPFAVRSTGHDFAGHSQHETLVIDTSEMNSIEVDTVQPRIQVGAGARNGAVSIALAQHGLALGGGTHESVGMAGITLGGGLGYFTRYAGMLCDQLESLKLVDPNGTLREVSATQDPDLFWACRGGGGGSLGVVTDLTYSVFRADNLTYLDAPVILDAVTAARLIHGWQAWVQSLPGHTTIHMMVSLYVGGQFLLTFKGMSLGGHEWLAGRLQDFFGAANDVADQWVDSRPSSLIMERLYGVPHVVSSLDFLGLTRIIADPIPQNGIIEVLSAMLRHPIGALNLNFEAVGGKASQPHSAATAYPHRSAQTIVHLTKTVMPHQRRDTMIAAMEEVAKSLDQYSTGGKYVNYPESDLPNWANAYWGENLPRLVNVKRRIDPGNMFRHGQSIPLE